MRLLQDTPSAAYCKVKVVIIVNIGVFILGIYVELPTSHACKTYIYRQNNMLLMILLKWIIKSESYNAVNTINKINIFYHRRLAKQYALHSSTCLSNIFINFHQN